MSGGTYDHEVTLISMSHTTSGIGDIIPSEIRATVLCKEKSIGRSEFYAAAAAGHKPEVILVVHRYEYGGQEELEYEGTRYSVLRTYGTDAEEIELICEGSPNKAGG